MGPRTVVLALIIGIGVSMWWTVHNMTTHKVMLPNDRHYAFRKKARTADRQGTFQTSDLVAGGRAVPDRGYLKIGTHRFWRGVGVVECTRGQELLTYWVDDESWEKIDKGTKPMKPLRCTTSEGLQVKVSVRIRYRIVDEDFWLLAIQTPGAMKALVAGDVVTTVNNIIGRRSVYEFANLFATIGREGLRLEIEQDLREKLSARHFELTETFLGPIEFPRDIAQSFADIVKSGAYAYATNVAAEGRAMANLALQPSLTPQIIALAQAEAPLHAAWTQWAGPHILEAGSTVRVGALPPPLAPPVFPPPTPATDADD